MYNFDVLLQRRHTDSTKWDALKRDFGRDDLMPFWVADADFPILPEIGEAIRARAGEGTTFGYTFAGDNYFDSIISWNKKRHNLDVLKEEIIPTPGVVTALAMILLAVTDKRDRVLINPPVYSPFFEVVNGMDRELIESPLIVQDDRYVLDFRDMEQKFAAGVKAYVLCSPHNPVGRVWEQKELEQLVRLCKTYGVILISDEIHYDIVYSGHRHTPILNVDPQAVLITAPSKTFNIAGLKSSVILVKDPEIRNCILKWVENMHLYLNLFAYSATETAYRKGEAWTDEMVDYLEENARFTVDYIEKEVPGVKSYMPESTYLMWLDFSKYSLSEKELNRKLLEEAKLALNPGAEYGEGYGQFVRLNIAAPRSYLAEGLLRLKKAFESEV